MECCSHGSWLVQVERERAFCQGRHEDQGWSVWNKVAHINLRRQQHQGCYLNTAGVPLPKPLISNIIMCMRNSPTLKMFVADCIWSKLYPTYLEQEAQKGPQVFVPPWQQAGYPPKHSPIPSTRLANWMATTRRKTAIDKPVKRFVWQYVFFL